MTEKELDHLIYEFCRAIRENATDDEPSNHRGGISFENEQIYFKEIISEVLTDIHIAISLRQFRQSDPPPISLGSSIRTAILFNNYAIEIATLPHKVMKERAEALGLSTKK